MTLQALYGIIPNISGKGDCAEVGIDNKMTKLSDAYIVL
jgi:hypothetical protein